MGRGSKRPPVSPLPKVQSVEVNDKHLTLRLVAAAFFFVVAVAAIVFAVQELLRTPTGWQEIDAGATTSTCATDFTLLYDLGSGSMSAKEELRTLKSVYSGAAGRAYQIFNAAEEFDGVGNLASLNLHPNEEVELDPALYKALELVEESGDRTVYLGPAFAVYDGIFTCVEDWQRDDFDPVTNPDIAALLARIAGYASDPQAVRVELLGDNRAKLCLSEEYMDFLKAEELEPPLDLYWMKNAFVADYLADALIDAGLTHGSISSYDGFSRNLDSRGTGFTMNVYAMSDGGPCVAAAMEYQGPRSIVAYRDFILSDADVWQIAVRDDGTTRTRFLNPDDGQPRVSTHSLVVYDESMGCGELALLSSHLYASQSLNEADLLSIGGAQAVWPDGKVVRLTDQAANVTQVYEGYEVSVVK